MNGKQWTQEEVDVLLREYEDPNIFPKDIAKKLNRTIPQVYCKAKAIGLKAPIERIRLAGKMDNVASMGTLAVGMGITDDKQVQMIEG